MRRLFPVISPLRRLCTGATGAAESKPASSHLRTLAKLTLLGRLGSTPQETRFQDGASSLTLSVATSIASMNEPETQWHRVFISENVPGYNYLKTLPAGTQVYIEGNYKLRTVEGEGAIRQYANVNVSRTQGLVRVLALPRRYESMNENDGDDLPF